MCMYLPGVLTVLFCRVGLVTVIVGKVGDLLPVP